MWSLLSPYDSFLAMQTIKTNPQNRKGGSELKENPYISVFVEMKSPRWIYVLFGLYLWV